METKGIVVPDYEWIELCTMYLPLIAIETTCVECLMHVMGCGLE